MSSYQQDVYPTDGYKATSTTYYSTGNSVSQDTVVPPSGFWYRETGSKGSTNTPGFKKLRASGARLPDNPFSFEKRIVSGGSAGATRSVSYQVSWPYYTEQISVTTQSPGWAGAVDHPSGPQSPDYSAVKFRLQSKARGNEFNTPVFIAEVGKTSVMVQETATRMVRMVRSLKRGELGDFVSLLSPKAKIKSPSRRELDAYGREMKKDPSKAFADYFLQYRYGWIPLMADLSNAVLTTMDLIDRPQNLETSVATMQTSSWTDVRTVPTSFFGKRLSVSQSTSVDMSTRGVWKFSLKPESVPGKLGLTNPFLVAWELYPLSFVADWFLPIGSYLGQFDTNLRFAHAGGTLGFKYDRKTQNVLIVREGDEFDNAFGFSQYRLINVGRQALTSSPTVGLSELSLQNPFAGSGAISKALSSVALLRQRLR